jgi:cytochrome bd-type quinol oxidase subunit 2
MIIDLVAIWTLILGLAVFYYVVFDGFDLGVGILSGLVSPEWRRLMMNSVAPIWDGNETWLVLGSIGLMAAFPLAFAIIFPAVYFPIVIMLLALVFRGVAFEFRFKGRPSRKSGARPSAQARRWRRSRGVSCSAHSSRASRLTGATSWAPRSTSSRRSRCSPGSP